MRTQILPLGSIRRAVILLSVVAFGQLYGQFPSFSQSPFAFAGGTVCETEPWRLVFSDEFIGGSFNPDQWRPYFPYTNDGTDNCDYCRLYDATSSQVMSDDQISVDDGLCHLKTTRVPATWNGQSRDYKAGMLYASKKYYEGKYEIRAKLPSGNRLWPAFWLNGNGSEIDAFEFCGAESMSTMHVATHRHWSDHEDTHGPAVGGATSFQLAFDPSADFHTYTFTWDYFFLRFFVDGNQIFESSRYLSLNGNMLHACEWALGEYLPHNGFPGWHNKMAIILNNALVAQGHSGVCSNPVSGNGPDNSDFVIDYVRVWQRANRLQDDVHDICNDERTLRGPSAVCESAGNAEYHVSGCHSELHWSVSPNLTIVHQDNEKCQVVFNGGGVPGESATVTAVDLANPCTGGNLSWTKQLFVGPPIIEGAGPEEQSDQCLLYYAIHAPRIHGSAPGPQGETNWFDVYIDGVLQTQTWDPSQYVVLPGNNGSGDEIVTTGGYAVIDHTAGFTYYTGQQDYCHTMKIVATNECGSTEVSFRIRDNCVLGACDIEFPDGIARLAAKTSLYPNPATTTFTVEISEQVDLSVIEHITVVDDNGYVMYTIPAPLTRQFQINALTWHPGIYHVVFDLIADKTMGKQELK